MNYKEYFKSKLFSEINEDMAATPERRRQLEKIADALHSVGHHDLAYDVLAQRTQELRSDNVHGLGGKVIDKGMKGLGYVLKTRNPSDLEIKLVQDIVDRIQDHIEGVPDDPDYATLLPDDLASTQTHPVYSKKINVKRK